MGNMKIVPMDAYRWKIPRSGAMRVPGIIYADESLLKDIQKDEALKQVANVASLPGVVKSSLAMPDIHWGYGFPIGGVAAFDCDDGIISPGGVGYDINCGVRLAATFLEEKDISKLREKLADALWQNIPAGMGVSGPVKLTVKEQKKVLARGSEWAVERGYGTASDLEATEDGGRMAGADPDEPGPRAMKRGLKQLGTLGSGNHFLEVGVVDRVFDSRTARAFHLFENQVVIMLHSGSRGFGHQVCDDFLRAMSRRQAKKKEFDLPDRQLACAPVGSAAGLRYYAAMACAANYAWANRQILMSGAGDVFLKTLGISPRDFGMRLVYDVCHNMAKKEDHVVDGKKRRLCVHRKGATRALPPGHEGLCEPYRDFGQPILIPGDMGSGSYVMAGRRRAADETFASACHGAGRALSRNACRKAVRGRAIHRELAEKGVAVRWTGRLTLAEEAPEAYKDISRVAEVVHGSGIAGKVARIRPVIAIKG
ncbi:tRNA-splicing ligase RtcB [Candidatus Desulfarcum epimagneticum]|uniref:tRNA-splicing ligase RtcB n=1 Tax=uncultured Desulfobacteraceae bacterium TaxID=218296 RepID=A0A484HKB3_9BACT|nr:tRNA-splicing ligase RtcB [uncultured Desulfobacteraceae bacterium]